MGGCVISKLGGRSGGGRGGRGGGEEEVVSICRERKRLMKLVVEKRYSLADAHCKYIHSLCAVSAAIKLFVARHSGHSSPFLITFQPDCSENSSTPPLPPPTDKAAENVIINPMFLQQRPSQSTHETVRSSSSSSGCSDSEVEVGGELEKYHQQSRVQNMERQQEEGYCGYFYMGMNTDMGMNTGTGMPPPMPSPQREFGWDFFNPFYGVGPAEELDMIRGFNRSFDYELKTVREEEGIPELEDEGSDGTATTTTTGKEKHESTQQLQQQYEYDHQTCQNVEQFEKQMEKQGGPADHTEAPAHHQGDKEFGRELLDALRDIEDHFIKAYDSGKDVSRMLEANKIRLTSGLDEIRENSTKLIQGITWHGSSRPSSSSCRSLVTPTSKNSSSWREYKNDLFHDESYGGMTAGSHSSTLGRLYAWEKKLFQEVKAGDNIRKLYERKCLHLRSKDDDVHEGINGDKSRAAVKDLYSQILVAIRRAESISEKIQKLTAEELQPQIIELLQGLALSWKAMLDSHETQNKIISEVSTYSSSTYGKLSSSDFHLHATLQLEAEIDNWRECFFDYVSAQRSYIEALHKWLSKFIVPHLEFNSKSSRRTNGPPLYTLCHDWLSYLENLPDRAVTVSMKSFVKDIRAVRVQQGIEQEQKRRVDKLAKELERKVIGYQKASESRRADQSREVKMLEFRPGLVGKVRQDEKEHCQDDDNDDDYLMERKNWLANFRKKLDFEMEKHQHCVQETQRITLNGFRTGFRSVFMSMVDFSSASMKMCHELGTEAAHNLQKDRNSSSASCSQGITHDDKGGNGKQP